MLQEASKLRCKHFESHHPTVENAEENLRFVRGMLSEANEHESEVKLEKGGLLDFVEDAVNNLNWV